jgi:ADP-heptose:LPS heptosyltransferase
VVNKILVNFPTNIGDTILALPAFDAIRAGFPQASIAVIVSPKTKDLLSRHTFVDEIIIYNKRIRLREKIRFCQALRTKFDLMVDFKNSFLPIILRIKSHTPLVRIYPKKMHAKDRYLKVVEGLVSKKIGTRPFCLRGSKKGEFILKDEEKERWNKQWNNVIFVACASDSSLKAYPKANLKKVIEILSRSHKIILLGDSKARSYYEDVTGLRGVIDLVGKTSFLDIYYLLKVKACLCICVDSSILHLVSYLNLPVLALFGPTDVAKYGPWSDRFRVLVRDDLQCRPCESSSCRFALPSLERKKGGVECMDIEPKKVVEAVESLLR